MPILLAAQVLVSVFVVRDISNNGSYYSPSIYIHNVQKPILLHIFRKCEHKKVFYMPLIAFVLNYYYYLCIRYEAFFFIVKSQLNLKKQK